MFTNIKIWQSFFVHFRRLCGILTVFSILSACPCFAAAGEDSNAAFDRKVTLKTAIQIALENNHQIKAFAYSVSASQQDVKIATSELLPKIALEESFTRTDTPAYVFSSKLNQGRFTSGDLAGAPGTFNNPGYLNNYQTIFSLEQPVFAPTAFIGQEIANKQSQATSEEFQRAREEITYSVSREYLKVQTAREMLIAAQNSIADANEHLRITKLQYDVNLGLYSDVLRATTEQKQSQQALITATKYHRLAKRQLGMAMGTQESIDIEPVFPLIEIKPIEYYTAIAISRKDLKAMNKKVEAAQKNIDLARAEYLPVVGLRADYQLDDKNNLFGSEGSGWLGAVFMKWYVFEGTKRDSQQAKARFELARVQENMLELENAISLKVYQAWLSVDEAKKNAELASAALDSAKEGERLVRKRYENALSPLVDLLDAQLMLDNARTNLVAKENEYRTAVMQLLFESGTIINELNLQ